MIRDAAAGVRWLNTFWAEAQRQGIVAPASPTPQEKKKREVGSSRYAHNAS